MIEEKYAALALVRACLYFAMLSLQAILNTSNLLCRHLRSKLRDVCCKVQMWSLYHGASLFSLMRLTLAGAITSRVERKTHSNWSFTRSR